MKGSITQSALDIKTYYAGCNQVTHPAIIAFSKPWNGYKYYMSYTTYPYANGSEENPCLAVSEDKINWVKPSGLINPIATCEETECDELKDSHLVYRSDLNRLEMWYMGRICSSMKDQKPLYLFRKISYDGINWGNYEIMFQLPFVLVSPTIIWFHDKYIIWFIKNNSDGNYLLSTTSYDGKEWTEFRNCKIPQIKPGMMWHGSISFIDEHFTFVFVGNKKPFNQHIYICTSNDGYLFSAPISIVKNNAGWRNIYRPFLLKDNNIYYLYYGIIRLDNRWLIGLSIGQTPYEFIGFNYYSEKSLKPERIKLRFKSLHKNILDSFPAITSITFLLSFFLIFFIENILVFGGFVFCISFTIHKYILQESICKSFIYALVNLLFIGGGIWFLLSYINYFS